ncbi:hypothetical protein PYW08_009639 [Mythimna loreyi]|uniref:Uncharacterized protein n=1 Tax=Mythimna loreyi TaxID=667449 RepID=A0ACC2QBF1_9NEOP|nr:hypothetical protein PYW08_009639 [Mythimna loreyi]
MVLVYILLLIPLTTATRRSDGPSYRSNVMDGDKPILRLGPERDETESDNSGLQDKPAGLPDEPQNDPEELNSALRDGDKPISKEGSKQTESDSGTGDSGISVDPSQQPPENKDNGLRSLKKKHKEVKDDPGWIKDLKDFIKDLTSQYGQHEVLEKTKPVIATLEKKHHMKIKDIDVDEYGEIHITYVEKAKSKKTSRKRKDKD